MRGRYLLFLYLFVPTIVAFLPHSLSNQISSRYRPETCPSRIFSSTSETSDTNIYQDYTMPILLVGYSGEGNELDRLAKNFLIDNFPNQGKVIHQPEPTILDEIDSMSIGWPNIIVVDLKKSCDEDLTATTKNLYEKGLLSIFINVDEVGSEDDKENKLEREDWLFANSDYELCIKDEGLRGGSEWEHIQWELSRLVARATLPPAVPGAQTPTTNSAHLTMGDHTFFLSLSFPEISQVEPYIEEMCADVDAMEYRTDLLDCRDSRFDLIYGMQLLRRYSRSHVVRVPALPFSGKVLEDVMPIVYTVRTQHQAGTYPDDEEGISKMFNMLDWGLRGGVEVLDVESAWDKDKTNELLLRAKQRYSSQILGSHHVVGEEVSSEKAISLFQQCALNGRAHGAKVVLSIVDEKKDKMAHEAALIASSLAEKNGDPVIPNISLILGDVGKFSRVINFPFTPVTHESLPFKAAPGQLTASEIMASRVIMKMLKGRRYAILGHNIAYSVSPQMQGAAFQAARLPHQYGRADVETVEEFVESDFFQDPLFGGCSVTIPHKQAIIPYVDVMSEAATTIGSVNTLIAKEEIGEGSTKRIIYGDNTDWKGIFNPIRRQLGQVQNSFALILGGGGTARAAAYAAQQLGLKQIYYNRTPSKAADLSESFGGTVVSSLEEEGEGSLGSLLDKNEATLSQIKVVISTLPAGAEFTLPKWLLSSSGSKPIIFDVNYKPYHTKLLEQAEAAGCNVVRGSEMLWEQGVGQFELWTGRTAPYAVMKAVVLQNCLPEMED